jgi:hypothetical protein
MELEKKEPKVVDLNTKLAIIKHLDEGHNIRANVDKFSISKRIVQAVKENRDLILKKAKKIVPYQKQELSNKATLMLSYGDGLQQLVREDIR